MKIQFKKADAAYVDIDKMRRDIANITCRSKTYIEIVCDVLQTMNSVTNNLTYKLKQHMEMAAYKIDDEQQGEFRELTGLIVDYYMLIQDFEFDGRLRKYNSKEYEHYHLYDTKRKIDLFRGVLFDAIVEAIVKKRFESKLFSTGCNVVIEGKVVCIYYDNGRKKQTFDIAGWNEEDRYGEFYECKIYPENYKEENYRLMVKLERILQANEVRDCGFVAVSAYSQTMFEKKIEELEKNCDRKLKKLLVFGKDTMFNLKELEMPICA